MTPRYYAPTGGLPGQAELTTDRAVFTEAYAVLPRGTMRDIVTSALPFWEQTRLWIIARPPTPRRCTARTSPRTPRADER